MAESKKLALKKQQATAKIFQGPQYIHVQGHAKMLQLTRSWEIDTLNATKDRDSHYTRCDVYSNVSTDSQEQSPACKRRTWCYTVARSFRQYGFMAFVF